MKINDRVYCEPLGEVATITRVEDDLLVLKLDSRGVASVPAGDCRLLQHDAPLAFRRFNDCDYHGFDGAEDFGNGTAPLIADIEIEGEETYAVVNGNGRAEVFTQQGTWAGEAGLAFGLQRRMSWGSLLALGFILQ